MSLWPRCHNCGTVISHMQRIFTRAYELTRSYTISFKLLEIEFGLGNPVESDCCRVTLQQYVEQLRPAIREQLNTKYIKPMIDPQIVDIPIPGEPVSLLSALQTAPSSLRS